MPLLGPAQRPRDPGTAPVPPEELEARAQEMLARLSVEGDDDGRVRSLSGRLQSRGAKVAVVAGAMLLLTGLVFGAMAVLGALLWQLRALLRALLSTVRARQGMGAGR